jgi:hypothetical protein
MVNLLTVQASGNLHINIGEMTTSNRIPILTLTPGSGEGQVGYGGSKQFGYTGPESFAVEDGVVYILDSVNDRVLLCGNGNYASIDTSDVPQAKRMKYQNKKIAVVDNTNGRTRGTGRGQKN